MLKTAKNSLIFLVTLIYALGIAFSDITTIRFATANPAGSAHVLWAKKMKELLYKYSNGTMLLEIHMDGIMGSEQDNVMDVSMGEIEMAAMAVNNITPFTKSVGFMTLPYMFPSNIKAKRLLLSKNKILDQVNKQMVIEANIRGIAWLNTGYRVLLNARKKIEHPSDLKGLNIRVPENTIMAETYRSWGIEPIPIAWTKTYESLVSGVVDGSDNPYVTQMNMPKMKKNIWEFQSHITDIHYILLIVGVIINEDFYQDLTEKQKELLHRASDEAAIYEWDWIETENKRLLKKLQNKGMILTHPANNEAEWIEKARKTWPKFYDKIGGKKLIDDALKLMK